MSQLLETHGEAARLLAGGQSLLPSLNLRLSAPALLIDINGITDLQGIGPQGRRLRIGALARHRELETSVPVKQQAPLIAAARLQAKPDALDIRDGQVVEAAVGRPRIGLDELAQVVYFRTDTLPKGLQPELVATRHFVPRDYPFAFTNGVQASRLGVDADTGFVTLLMHWVVEDCGRVLNPMLVEECLYDGQGQMLNATLADYLVPMAAEMPDIVRAIW